MKRLITGIVFVAAAASAVLAYFTNKNKVEETIRLIGYKEEKPEKTEKPVEKEPEVTEEPVVETEPAEEPAEEAETPEEVLVAVPVESEEQPEEVVEEPVIEQPEVEEAGRTIVSPVLVR